MRSCSLNAIRFCTKKLVFVIKNKNKFQEILYDKLFSIIVAMVEYGKKYPLLFENWIQQ